MIKIGLYKHFKGQMYRVLATAEHSETGEIMVVYMALYDTHKLYVRPLAMFTEQIKLEDYPACPFEGCRFTYVGDSDE